MKRVTFLFDQKNGTAIFGEEDSGCEAAQPTANDNDVFFISGYFHLLIGLIAVCVKASADLIIHLQ